jgi:hypothetical protein
VVKMGPKMVSGRKNVGEIGPNDSVATVEIINTFKMIKKNRPLRGVSMYRRKISMYRRGQTTTQVTTLG